MSQLTDVIDAVIADLDANVNLGNNPTPTIHRYTPPRYDNPELLPILAVYADDPATSYDLLTTVQGPEDDYLNRLHLVVEWTIDNPQGAELGGVTDPDTFATITATAELIVKQLKTYTGGIPGLANPNVTATITNTSIDPTEGNEFTARTRLDVQT